MRASLSNHRQSPRKVRLLAPLLVGMRVDRALSELKFLPKRAAKTYEKLLKSALANMGSVSQNDFLVASVRVDKGRTLKRFMPKMGGRTAPIKKRSSNILIELKPISE